MTRTRIGILLAALVAAGCNGADTTGTTTSMVQPTTTAVTASTTAAPPPATSTAAPTTTSPPTTSTTTPTTTTSPPTTTAAPTTTTAAPTTTAPPTTTTTAAPATTTTAIDYVALGAELALNLGCGNCHSTNGAAGLGPTWAGLAGSTVTLTDGSTVTASSNYIEESIRFPDAKIVEGFSPGLMQSSYNSLSNDEIRALVAYVSSR